MKREIMESAERLPGADENFVDRWSRLKQQSSETDSDAQPGYPGTDEPESPKALTDADMPDIESLTPDSDYTGFLSSEVSESLRRLALRKLFQGAEFNVRDGLDDYDQDFTSFAKLGDIITADMKHLLEQELRRAKERKAAEEAGDANSTDEEAIGEEIEQEVVSLSEPESEESDNPEERIDEPSPE